MKNFIIALTFLIGFSSFTASAAKSIEVFHFQNELDYGVKALKSAKFDEAFEHLEKASKLGNKTAQYELAILYARGQGTKRDFAQAYLWMNVVTEVQHRKWEEFESKLDQLLTSEQKKNLAPFVDKYIQQYGKKTQEVLCKRQANMGSNVKYMFCEKLLDSGQIRFRTKIK